MASLCLFSPALCAIRRRGRVVAVVSTLTGSARPVKLQVAKTLVAIAVAAAAVLAPFPPLTQLQPVLRRRNHPHHRYRRRRTSTQSPLHPKLPSLGACERSDVASPAMTEPERERPPRTVAPRPQRWRAAQPPNHLPRKPALPAASRALPGVGEPPPPSGRRSEVLWSKWLLHRREQPRPRPAAAATTTSHPRLRLLRAVTR
ncbi:unnamed protein product, partial [Laminaria digitata]